MENGKRGKEAQVALRKDFLFCVLFFREVAAGSGGGEGWQILALLDLREDCVDDGLCQTPFPGEKCCWC